MFHTISWMRNCFFYPAHLMNWVCLECHFLTFVSSILLYKENKQPSNICFRRQAGWQLVRSHKLYAEDFKRGLRQFFVKVLFCLSFSGCWISVLRSVTVTTPAEHFWQHTDKKTNKTKTGYRLCYSVTPTGPNQASMFKDATNVRYMSV